MLFDYTAVTPASLQADLEAALVAANQLIDDIVAVEGDRTYDNTVAPSTRASELVAIAYGRGPFLGHASPDEDVRNIARQMEETLSKWGVELTFRDDLYNAVAEFANGDVGKQLDGEEGRLLDMIMRDFRMAGHELAAEQRAELKQLNERLVELGVIFSTNIAEFEDFLVVTRSDLAEMPDNYIDNLKPGEKEGTYCVSMAYPDVVPFMDNVSNRDLREALSRKFSNRAADLNRPILAEAVEVRQRIADIFDVPSWAHHSMQVKMAKNPEAVFEFYDSLVPALTSLGHDEKARMSDMLEADTGDTEMQSWDWRYYHSKLRREHYGVDALEVANYLPVEAAISGMLDLTHEMFGVDYEQVKPTNAWHEDVTLWKVSDTASGEHIGHFYMDLFPREGKFSHAAAWDLVPAHEGPDGWVHPISAVLANFPKPSTDRPGLLTHDDLVTLFHEFGHILHMTFSKARIIRFSGAGTEWDFVEAPSQIMEHWCWKPQILQRFALHHETGEPIPTELVDQIQTARYVNEALAKLRQVSYGMVDMYLHGPNRPDTLDEALTKATEFSLFPLAEDTFFLASFGHMFGYDAGYYGYLWAEVYGDDMFSRFESEGIDNPAVGMDYRSYVLEPNGTKDGHDLVAEFLGREPSSDAFLGNLGLN